MKFRPNNHYTTIAIYAFLVLAAAILLNNVVANSSGIWSGIQTIMGFLRPVAYGVLIACVLNPMLRFYDDKMLAKIPRIRQRPVTRRAIAILLTHISIILLIVVMVCLAIPQMVGSFRNMIDSLPGYAANLNTAFQDVTKTMDDFWLLEYDSEIYKFIIYLSDQFTVLLSSLSSNIDSLFSTAASSLISAGTKMAAGIVNWILGIVISIYLMFDREKLFAQMRKTCTALLPERIITWVNDVSSEAGRIFNDFLVGKIIGSLIFGTLCTIGMLILRIPYPLPIGVMIGITNIFPYFGPFIGAVIGALLILLVDPLKAIIFLIFVILLQQFDNNIIEPKILGGRTGLSSLWVIVSIMLFGGLFGIVGMFLGVPLFAIIYTVTKRIIGYLLKRKGKSSNTRDYASESNPLLK